MSMFRAKPHHPEAAANAATPKTYTLRRPKMSPREPHTRSSAANIKAYDSTTHCTSATEAWKAFCSAGSATLTTVPSINAMLDPRMVAASTMRPLVRELELSLCIYVISKSLLCANRMALLPTFVFDSTRHLGTDRASDCKMPTSTVFPFFHGDNNGTNALFQKNIRYQLSDVARAGFD